MKLKPYDFSGWATRNNRKCSDGRTILKDAFIDNDGQTVPLVWNHQHNESSNVLGHCVLENCEDGVRAYGYFNDTEAGRNAKALVEHGDVNQLSIYANQLKQKGSNVLHGAIREVSLVLAGANPGAFIDSVIKHGEESDEEAIIYTGEDISLYHANGKKEEKKEEPTMEEETKKETMNEDDETIADVLNTLTEKQKTVVYAMIGQALEENGSGKESKGGDETMKHNVFDTDDREETYLSHSDLEVIFKRGKQLGSLREAVYEQMDTYGDALAHAATYGIDNMDYLFPDVRNVTDKPIFIQRDMGWVQKVIGATHHTPFSRIKSLMANITEDEARAKGYIKGNLKKDEVFSLLKRTTTPTTIYKKQKMDRDDIIDVTDFDVVSWVKAEMRMMLDEEIARAILIGDGRPASSDDKINEMNIRPIWTDEDLYTIKAVMNTTTSTTEDQRVRQFIRTAVKSRKNYKGSGEPSLYTTEDMLTDCLLLEDSNGRVIYDTIDKLAKALRVKEIITVPVMEDLTRTDGDGNTRNLLGIITNLTDYNVGADKGGAVNMFDDFDIDYNQQKYLIETRCSGALIKPFAAIALEEIVA